MKKNNTFVPVARTVFFCMLLAALKPVDAHQVTYKRTTDIPA